MIAAAKELGVEYLIIADRAGKKVMLPLEIEILDQAEKILGRPLAFSKEHLIHWGSAQQLGGPACSEPMPELSARLEAHVRERHPRTMS